MTKLSKTIALLAVGSILFTACGKALPEVASESSSAECIAYESSDMSNATIVEEVTEPIIEDYPFSFVDVFGNEYTTQINPAIPQKPYLDELFIHNGDKLSYEDGVYTSRLGVDVSHHQGKIDWNKVKDDGFDFAFIRVVYRGYGQAGKLCEDREGAKNIKAAQEAGLDVGVYVFSQAINEEEAIEEADLVLSFLSGYDLQLPIVFDPESILDDEARTDNVSGEQFTRNTIAFCNKIKEAGYMPAVYSNMLWEAYQLDLSSLSDIKIWYADYEAVPQTPYDFDFWQYSESATVSGVDGVCDVDIQMIRK